MDKWEECAYAVDLDRLRIENAMEDLVYPVRRI